MYEEIFILFCYLLVHVSVRFRLSSPSAGITSVLIMGFFFGVTNHQSQNPKLLGSRPTMLACLAMLNELWAFYVQNIRKEPNGGYQDLNQRTSVPY